MIPHLYPSFVPLQAFALFSVFQLLSSDTISEKSALTAGLIMGLSYSLPMVVALKLPLVISLFLTLSVSFLIILYAGGAWLLLRGPVISSSIGLGALFVLADWVNFSILSFWGTAQSFVRPWSFYPAAIQFISITGITGIAFFLGTFQALVFRIFKSHKKIPRQFFALFALLLIFFILNVVTYTKKPSGVMKVAAIGWSEEQENEIGDLDSDEGFTRLFVEPLAEAAKKGARLIVSPELGFYYGDFRISDSGDNEGFNIAQRKWFDKFRDLAVKFKVYLAIGYYNRFEEENRLFFMDPNGDILNEYTKTHLIPFSMFKRGTGEEVIVKVDEYMVGGMICHDDNYTDISRKYGRSKTPVVVVPTLDWPEVKDAHFQSSIFRAIESCYVSVRATCDGVSAVILPDGKVIKQLDHVKNGAGYIISEVPVYSQKTIFDLYGHWPVLVCFMYLFIYAIIQRWWRCKKSHLLC